MDGIVVLGIVVLFCYLYGDGSTRNAKNQNRRRHRFPSRQYNEELVSNFSIWADDLGSSDTYISDVKRIARTIFELLKKHGNVKLVRSQIAGSIGKGTDICYMNKNGRKVNPDLDLIVFLDDVEPPFTEYLKLFAKVLINLDEVSDIKIRRYSIQFKFWTRSHGHIKVDLLAAENLVSNSYSWRKKDVAEVGALVALRGLRYRQKESISNTQSVSQEENKVISSSLAEKTVKVIRELVVDDYVLKVVRLAKYWNKNINLSTYGYVPARSCIIETIAISTQLKAFGKRNNRGRCIVSGFRLFLEAVSKFSSLDISLTNNAQTIHLENYTKPRIVDPVNSWNNLAEGIPAGAIKIWEDQAKRTLVLLKEWSNDKLTDDDVDFENAIDEIFSHKSDTLLSKILQSLIYFLDLLYNFFNTYILNN